MPEDLPLAVKILVWLLIGLIVLGYLIMAFPLAYAGLFVVVYYALPVLIWYFSKSRQEPNPPA